MNLFIPSTLDVNAHIASHPPFKGFEKEKLLYIVHCIINIPLYNKNISVVNGFVPLSSKALQQIIPNYKLYLDYGVATGILTCDNYYRKGLKCFGYKILLPYGADVKMHEIQTYHLNKSYTKHLKELKESLKGLEFLERWFAKGLEFDIEAAQSFLKEEYALKNQNVSLWDYKQVYNYQALDVDGTKGVYETVYKDPFLQHQQGLLSVLRMERGSFSCTISANGKRFHSVLTNMRSLLRNFLTFKGERLVSIDIKNSQPYLITALLQSSFWESQKIVKKTARKDVIFKKKVSKKAKCLDILSNYFNDNNLIKSNELELNIDMLSIHIKFLLYVIRN